MKSSKLNTWLGLFTLNFLADSGTTIFQSSYENASMVNLTSDLNIGTTFVRSTCSYAGAAVGLKNDRQVFVAQDFYVQLHRIEMFASFKVTGAEFMLVSNSPRSRYLPLILYDMRLQSMEN